MSQPPPRWRLFSDGHCQWNFYSSNRRTLHSHFLWTSWYIQRFRSWAVSSSQRVSTGREYFLQRVWQWDSACRRNVLQDFGDQLFEPILYMYFFGAHLRWLFLFRLFLWEWVIPWSWKQHATIIEDSCTWQCVYHSLLTLMGFDWINRVWLFSSVLVCIYLLLHLF